MARLYWYLNPLSSHQLKKKRSQHGSPLKKLFGSAHGSDHAPACSATETSYKLEINFVCCKLYFPDSE